MADEEKKQPTPIDPENPSAAIQAEQGKSIRELRDVPMEEIPTEKLPEIAKEVKESETPAERELRRQVEATLNQPIEAVEDAVNALDRKIRRQYTMRWWVCRIWSATRRCSWGAPSMCRCIPLFSGFWRRSPRPK